MLFVRDKGQTCNNILQYGHVYAWGRANGRSTMSMRFAYKYRWFAICRKPWHNFFVYVTAKMLGKLHLLPIITYPDIYCTPEENEANVQRMLSTRHAIVEGWTVRFYDLFLQYRDEICALFAFLPPTEHHVARVLGPDKHQLTIGMHIRRGDYRNLMGGRYFFDDDTYIAYLRDTIRQYDDGRPVRVFVCSNDPRLNRKAYVDAFPGVEINFPDGSPDQDLCLLSHCDVLVGTISTFSLVAAMFRDLPLCWIDKATVPDSGARFLRFDYLFRHITDGTDIQR